MSQTLSLEPDKYILFITPPVAGVDFTGTPTPSVSYQWRKNGTAIVGQTASTITGVWVEQSGGTVDLVDGDTISIDIILTNPVQVTTKTVSAVIDASIPAPVISPISIRLVSAPTTPVSSIPNASIGSQIMVASTGSVSVVTTPPLLPTYQWRRGFAAIAGANSPTYTLQAADADSIIDCVVTATNSGGTTTRTASATVGTLPAAGWTELTPSADSRLIYVSNDGDDVAAASVKGRGYYLPGDSEIGADPTNPAGPIVAYRSAVEAAKRVRLSRCTGEDANGFPTYVGWSSGGFPDWVLFKRGETFSDTILQENPYNEEMYNYSFSMMLAGFLNPSAGWNQSLGRIWSGTGEHRGRSQSEPAVVTAWGNPSDERPKVLSHYIGGEARHLRIVSLDTYQIAWGNTDVAPAGDIVVEDCKLRHIAPANVISLSYGSGLTVRRCSIYGMYRTDSNSEGFYVYDDNSNVVIEECVFDLNGYREDPLDATKWTATVANQGGYTQGTGAQPLRNARDRNLYLAAYASMTVRGNIFSRGGGGGSVQMREGGLAERNLFIWNETALSTVHPQARVERHKGSIAKNNVVLHDDCFLPGASGWGGGITVGGTLGDLAVNDSNIIAHFHRGNNGGESIGLSGKPYYDGTRIASKLMQGIAKDNVVYREYGGTGIMVMDNVHDWGVLAADIINNTVSTSGTLDVGSGTIPGMLSMQGNSSEPAEFTYSGNRFHATVVGGGFRWGWSSNLDGDWRTGPYSQGDFSQWQALGFDTDATLTNDFAAFKDAVGWTAPERDIVSYMQSVDPTYEVNEDVYIDEDATVKQSTRQKVWEVLSNPASYPSTTWWQTRGLMSEARAKLAARRYHAFITFIQRARQNRRGAWDTRYTAEAVSNYIREGFGKATVTGAYDSRSLADRLLDYTT
jgi:hypothetical protein